MGMGLVEKPKRIIFACERNHFTSSSLLRQPVSPSPSRPHYLKISIPSSLPSQFSLSLSLFHPYQKPRSTHPSAYGGLRQTPRFHHRRSEFPHLISKASPYAKWGN